MRLLAIVLIAACGGSSAPPPATLTSLPGPASGEEDWRGVLSQWVGTWSFKSPHYQFELRCNWVGAFVACVNDSSTTLLLGYEPINRRYVAWPIDEQSLDGMSGTGSVSSWVLEGAGMHLTWKRTSPTTWTQHIEGQGPTDDGVFTRTTPEAAVPAASAPPAASSIDWRAELQALVGTWTFTGTLDGQPLSYTEVCAWVPAATFIYCRNTTAKQVSLTGWEPQTQQFATYGFGSGQTHRLSGTVQNHNWTFTDGTARLTMTRVSPLEFQLRGTSPTGQIFEGSYVTKPE